MPPAAEFLVAAGDSTYWVTSGRGGTRLRGSPIALTRYGSRFYEVYVTHDDRSFYDALFVGQRIYRRDIVTGDSALVFDDSTVTRVAQRYALRHPTAEPLGPDDDASEDPHAVATGEVQILDVHGPYLSYEYHADVDVAQEDELHATRRGVIDLRSGGPATVADIFGREAGALTVARGRRAYRATLAAVRARRDPRARRAAAALGAFTFDERSFAIVEIGREPGAAFLVPGTGEQGGGLALPLPPVPVPAPDWWAEVRDALPASTSDSTGDRWTRGAYEVVAVYDSVVESLAVTLRAGGRAWPVGHIQAPAHHIYWLDGPGADSAARHALARAFDESALYSDEARLAAAPLHPPRAPELRLRVAALRPAASTSVRCPPNRHVPSRNPSTKPRG